MSAVSGHDVIHVVPVVLLLLTLLLALGLRSLVAPLYLVASVALSYLASLGLAILIFQLLGGAPGVNFALPFFLFVFVMALGEDYNILVMGRIREEAVNHPPREAVRRAILATGGTITAAGLVLAGTFGVLAVVTSGQIRQIGAGSGSRHSPRHFRRPDSARAVHRRAAGSGQLVAFGIVAAPAHRGAVRIPGVRVTAGFTQLCTLRNISHSRPAAHVVTERSSPTDPLSCVSCWPSHRALPLRLRQSTFRIG